MQSFTVTEVDLEQVTRHGLEDFSKGKVVNLLHASETELKQVGGHLSHFADKAILKPVMVFKVEADGLLV